VTKLNVPVTQAQASRLARVVYIADQQVDVWELHVPIAGGPAHRDAAEDVLGDSRHQSDSIAWRIADQETVGTLELFVTFDDTILHPPIFIPLVRR
jgi:hypothetical protein